MPVGIQVAGETGRVIRAVEILSVFGESPVAVVPIDAQVAFARPVAGGNDVQPAVVVHVREVHGASRKPGERLLAVQRGFLADESFALVVFVEVEHAAVVVYHGLPVVAHEAFGVFVIIQPGNDDVQPAVFVIVAHGDVVARTPAAE